MHGILVELSTNWNCNWTKGPMYFYNHSIIHKDHPTFAKATQTFNLGQRTYLPLNKRPMYVCGWATTATQLPVHKFNHTVPFLQEPRNCAKSYAVSCQPFTVTVQIQPQVSHGTGGGHSGTTAGSSLNILVITCQFKATNAPYSFPHPHRCCGAGIAQSV